MNKNEIKYIEDNEPTPQELDQRLLNLAEEDQFFSAFLSGWMSNQHLPEMARAARAWLDTHHPDQLEEFDSPNKGN
tara:strand:- start:295 stop:522 length:228 start_codon:yes stop_codon:yes gene_type:complete